MTLGLEENSPLANLSMAWTQGLLSVRTQTFDLDWMMYGLKCLTAEAMASASISQGSHVTWCFLNLALKKNPAKCNLLSREMYSVAPIPRLETDPSLMIHN